MQKYNEFNSIEDGGDRNEVVKRQGRSKRTGREMSTTLTNEKRERERERKETTAGKGEEKRGKEGVSTSHELREHCNFKGLLDFQL